MRLTGRLTLQTQRRLTRGMQVLLVLIVVYGLLARQPKAITNGIVSLAVTALPAVLERRYDFPLDPWLGLWITAAVCLHTLGSAGLYSNLDWWDHVTHALSASLVAGVGYTSLRAVDLHSPKISIPPRFAFAYILIVVLAFGVVWELFEYGLDVASATWNVTMPLAQHGLDDTVVDLLYNMVGALIVAGFGQVHLSPLAENLRERFLGEIR